MQVSIQRISITHLREVTLPATCSAVNQTEVYSAISFTVKVLNKGTATEPIISKRISSALFGDLTSLIRLQILLHISTCWF